MSHHGNRVAWQSDRNFPARCVRQGILKSCVKMRDVTKLLDIISLTDFDSDEVFDSERETCCMLCMLVTHDWTEGLRIVLNQGADVNKTIQIVECCFERTRHTITPLMAAVWFRHLHCAAILVAFGADVNYMDPNSYISILHIAVYTNNPEAVKFLISPSSTILKRYIMGNETMESDVANVIVNDENSPLANQYTADELMDIDVMAEDVPIDDDMVAEFTDDDARAGDGMNGNNILGIIRGADGHYTLLTLALHNMGYRVGGFTKDPPIMVDSSKVRQSKSLSVLKMILEAGGEAVEKVLCQSPRLLFDSCTGTDTRVLRLFIRYGADINAKMNPQTLNEHHRLNSSNVADFDSISNDSMPLSLLTYFLLAGYFEAANLLVDSGARVATNDFNLITAAFNTISNNDETLSASQETPYINALYWHLTNVPTLAWLCKRTVRVDAGVRTKRAIRKLPLPELLKQYLSGLEL